MVKSYNSSKSNTSAVKDGDGGGPDNIDIEDPAKTYNTSKSNTSSEDHGGGGGGPDETQGTDYHTTRDTKSVSDGDLVGDGGGSPGDPAMIKSYNSSKSNTSSVSDGDLVGDGGGTGEPAMAKTYNSSKSNTSRSNNTEQATSGGDLDIHNSTRSNRGAVQGGHDTAKASINNVRSVAGGGGGGTGVIGSTFGLAKTILMAAVLLTAVGVGFDLYQTYNDAIDLNLEDHVTDADFALNNDKTEINGDIGFNIPEMGMFEKKILAKVHVTVLESNPTTDGDYSFEYTLGSGEHTYRFSLTDLDPVTVEKIDAGEDLELEYTTSITVIYLGVELAPATTDMPAKTVTVETA